jgi:hypothetical protein
MVDLGTGFLEEQTSTDTPGRREELLGRAVCWALKADPGRIIPPKSALLQTFGSLPLRT